MASAKPQKTKQSWGTEFDTLRRQDLFRNPPEDQTAYPMLYNAIAPHVDSFNAIFEPNGLLHHALEDIGTKVIMDGDPAAPPADGQPRNRLSIKIKEVIVQKPQLPPSNKFNVTRREIMPSECRERHSTYRGRLTARLHIKVNNGDWREVVRELGLLPIMLRSNRCHLQHMAPAALVASNEESEELGGYFVVNGNEKLIRMLVVNKRNFPMAIERPSFQKRGKTYSKYGVQIRSVRPDQTSQTNCLHYLVDGNVTFRFSWRKNEYVIPVMMVLNALVETNDREICEGIVGRATEKDISQKQFVLDRIELLLRTYKGYNLHGKKQTRAHLGRRFRPALGVSEAMSDYDVGTDFLRKVVVPHLGNYNVTEAQDLDKFRQIVFMIRKLYSLAEGECCTDNPDAVSSQEILLPGFLYGMILKEKLEEWLTSIRIQLSEWGRGNGWTPFTAPDFEKDFIGKVLRKTNETIGPMLEYFMSTGNLVSQTGLDLQQTSGFTVVAEKINFLRFISHFRMVHRGSFFAQLKTTTVRKLLPESWGFLCPVHTPDGSPCGLLNHLSHQCKIATSKVNTDKIPQLVTELGVVANTGALLENSVVVQLDGRILGFCSPKQALTIHDTFRYWKVQGGHGVPAELEIGFIPTSKGGQYPGVYISSEPARMYRPVNYLPLGMQDWVGPFEQPYMGIACAPEDIISGYSTHLEFTPTHILSILANMTPFSDFNQSPRNMYQCLSADHEVLTNTGWKSLPLIQSTDQVMTMDLATGIQQWNQVQATTRLRHDGSLYRLKSASFDAVCDESHRWYLNTRDQPSIYTAFTTQQMLDSQLVALRSASGKNIGQWDRKGGTTTHRNHSIPAVGKNSNPMYLWPECPWLSPEFVADKACNLDWCRFVGLVLGDGGIRHRTGANGQEYFTVVLYQCASKPGALAYIKELLDRLAANIPSFLFGPPVIVDDHKGLHTWTIRNRAMYDFFLPMIRGPKSYDPLDDAMCRNYQAHTYQALARSPNELVLPPPEGWKIGFWWYLKRWIYYEWLYLLARDQARAMIKGIAAADGEWSLLLKARSNTGGSGRGGGSAKKRKSSSLDDVQSEELGIPLINRGVVRVFNSSIPLMHDLSVLGLLADTRTNTGVNHKKGEWMPSVGFHANATGWRISFSFAESELAVAAPRPEVYDNPRHDGFVYCLTVPNGNFMARRMVDYNTNVNTQEVLDAAQKPFFTGNCQMGKQTMGTPGTSISHRTDNKSYRLLTGQTPIVRAPLHNAYGFDNFPNGCNAVVAVIAYTGYDMDDGMILNKSSKERGFGEGFIYKTMVINISKDSKSRTAKRAVKLFGFAPGSFVPEAWRSKVDEDGLPRIGERLEAGDVIAVSHTVSLDPVKNEYVNRDGQTERHLYKEDETAFVEEVRLIGSETGDQPLQAVSIKLCIPRTPIIGDKFSSRHGQKGVCSQKWPSIDMPFSESGIQPDVIINPHAFPSRMTIGMFVESLAGKAGALHGFAQECTPFQFDEKDTAVDFFGEQLKAAGYNYYGNEPMYSGITGQELAADIYIGVVYYQRLRHMVNDKYQVRTTGRINPTTGQPIKGRKKGGGIRVGEMERDALLAHGTAFLLQDRLLNCSDYQKAWICKKCGSFLSPTPIVGGSERVKKAYVNNVRCRRCATKVEQSMTASGKDTWEDGNNNVFVGGEDVGVVAVPGVLKFLDAELSAMGVRMKFNVGP